MGEIDLEIHKVKGNPCPSEAGQCRIIGRTQFGDWISGGFSLTRGLG